MNDKTLQIQYPTFWEYLIVTLDKDSLESTIKERFGALNHTLAISKTSKEGKYTSYNFSVLVSSQDERDDIFSIISAINGVKVVI